MLLNIYLFQKTADWKLKLKNLCAGRVKASTEKYKDHLGITCIKDKVTSMK